MIPNVRKLIREIHRRSLWQVLLVYAGASYAVLEAVDIIAGRLMLPDVIPGLALVLILVGLPVVLATAFVQENGADEPDGERQPPQERPGRPSGPGPDEASPGPARWLTWRHTLTAGIVAFAIWGMIAAGSLLLRGGEDGRRPGPIRSVAVLPLDNFSEDSEETYFADAMTEKMITELARIDDLMVSSRAAVLPYREHRPSIREIARKLNVDAVIEGSVLRVGDEVRITAQLIDGATEAHLWANDYVRDFRDLIQLQRDVALAIAEEVEVELSPAEEQRLATGPSIAPAAQTAFLRGVHLQRRFQDTGEDLSDLELAIEFLREAVEREPTWAEAHAELARAYHWLASSGGGSRYYPPSREAALEAIRLDPSHPAGHVALAFVLHNYDADWTAAEAAYRRALELAPGEDYHHWGYALYLLSAGRYDESAESFRRALRHAPLSGLLQEQLARSLLCAGRFDEGRRRLEQLVRVDPDRWSAHAQLGALRMLDGETREGIEHIERIVGTSERSTLPLVALTHAYARTGRRAEARALLSELEARDAWMPHLYAALGQHDRAIEQLERALEERSARRLYIRCLFGAPTADLTEDEVLREDPRFQRVLQEIDFPA